MFTVIEHQQQFLGPQELHQRLARALFGPGGHREQQGDGIIDPGGVADRGQLSKPRAVGEPWCHLGGSLQRQAGLAHPAHAGQGHHPRLAQHRRGLLQFAGPADERAHRQRDIADMAGWRGRAGVVARDPARQLDAGVQAEFGEDVGDVCLDRRHRDEQLGGDRWVGQPARHEPGDLQFAGAQLVGVVRRGSRRAMLIPGYDLAPAHPGHDAAELERPYDLALPIRLKRSCPEATTNPMPV